VLDVTEPERWNLMGGLVIYVSVRRDVGDVAMVEAGAWRGATMGRARVVRDAFTRAVASHRQALARFAFMLCGDAGQAEDVVAEAYARVWPQWRRGRVDDLLPYLRRTVANEVYQRHRRRVLERREAARPPDRRADDRFEVSVDDREVLWAALARLSRQQRVVVVLRIVEDLSEEQTAAMLGIPVGTVKSRLSRALAVLRATLEDDRE
jgi:RNA polymerase sigma-70 factor (sigma-E family)